MNKKANKALASTDSDASPRRGGQSTSGPSVAGRIAGVCALFAFAASVVVGLVVGDNPLETVLLRGMVGMGVTLGVGAVVGVMATRMVAESLERDRKRLEETRQLLAEKRAAVDDTRVRTVGGDA